MSRILTREEFKALPLDQRLPLLYDPMNFFRYCVWTRDERDKKVPLKAAPVWETEPHFKWYVEPCVNILNNFSEITLFDKSRRLWISYTILAFILHHNLTHTDQRVGVVTEKAEKSQEHLNNIKIINEHIPEDVWPQACRPVMTAKEGLLTFGGVDNYIHGLASGPDQARQFGFSMLFFDEMDFWDDQELTWAAAVPTTDHIIVASTHRMQSSGVQSFYRRLVNDEVNKD